MNKLHDAVGKRRVKIVDEDTDEVLGTGILQSAHLEVGDDRMTNLSEACVALDIPEVKDDGDPA